MKETKVKSGDGQVLVEPTGTLFWRPLNVLLLRRAGKYFFPKLFRQFRILNCNLSDSLIVICIARQRNPTLTNREKNCRQGRFAADTRQSRGRQRIS
jgi:hypothetical protein